MGLAHDWIYELSTQIPDTWALFVSLLSLRLTHLIVNRLVPPLSLISLTWRCVIGLHVYVYADVAWSVKWHVSMLPCCTNSQLPRVKLIWLGKVCLCWCALLSCWSGPIMVCHLARWWGPLARSAWWWGPPGWDGPIGECHVAFISWAGPIRYCHVAHFLSPSLFYIHCISHTQIAPRLLLSPNCTQMNLWLNLSLWSAYLICFIFPEFILIAPLIQKLWNFHQKIPKFMMIIPIIFNSIFTPVSLN
jgi:hypothetical protein